MQKLNITVSLMLFCLASFSQKAESVNHNSCGVTLEIESRLGSKEFDQSIENYISEMRTVDAILKRKEKSNNGDCPNGITIIPIAFNLFHEENASIGTGHNFALEDLRLTVDYLNMHFSGFNAKKDIINDNYVDFDGAQTCIQFTIGKINRIDRSSCSYWVENGTHYQLEKCLPGGSGESGENSPNDYLNIYVNDLKGGLLGQASCIPGIFGNCNSNSDGVTIDWDVMVPGKQKNGYFNLGGVLVHEIGHWLGLPHVDGDIQGSGCNGDDGMSDTYPQAQKHAYICSQPIPNTCETPDNIYNFMDYSLDCAKLMFTQQQSARMDMVLKSTRSEISSAYQRLGLKNNNFYNLVTTSPNVRPIEWKKVSCDHEVNLNEYLNKWNYNVDEEISHPGLKNYYWERVIPNNKYQEKKVVDGRYLSKINVVSGSVNIERQTLAIYTLKSKLWSVEKRKYGNSKIEGIIVFIVQPCETIANDLISDATKISRSIDCLNDDYSLIGASKSPSNVVTRHELQPDAWFIFNSHQDNEIEIVLKRSHSNEVEPYLDIYTMDMVLVETIEYQTTQGRVINIPEIGKNADYYIRVYDKNETIIDPFQICFQTPKLKNDICSTATHIEPSDNCTWSSFSNIGATKTVDSEEGYNCGAKSDIKDIWMKTIVPATGNINIKCRNKTGDLDLLLLEIYSGDCEKLELLSCRMIYPQPGKENIININLENIEAGSNLLIRTGGGGNNNEGEIDICISNQVEHKCEINLIELGNRSSCDMETNTFSQEVFVHYQSIYDNINIYLNNVKYALTESPQRIVMQGLPANSRDISIDARLHTTSTSDCWNNSRYYIDKAIKGEDSCFDGEAINDFCIDAIELKVNNSCDQEIFSNLGATVDFSEDYSYLCIGYKSDVWFKIKVPASGNIEIRTPSLYNGNHIILEAFRGECDNFEAIGCDRYSTGRGSWLKLENLIVGEYIYIRAADLENDTSDDFAICVYESAASDFLTSSYASEPDILEENATEADDSQDIKMKIYPNPSSQYITIKYDTPSDLQKTHISIYDSNGNRVFQQEQSDEEQKINISYLTNGIYYVHSINGPSRTIQRFVKI